MNITLSQKSIRNAVLVIALILVLGVSGYYAWMSGQQMPPFVEPTEDEPALLAVATIYSPDPSTSREAWEDQVCSGMTAKGCSIFKVMYAPAIWKTAAPQENQATATYLSTAETLEDGSQIWKVSVAATAMPADTSIYVHVAAGPESGRWLLNRVLFSQEAAKYAQP